MSLRRSVAALAVAFLALAAPARAEPQKVRLAKQVGLASLTLLVMEHEKLLEKHLAASGLAGVEVNWSVFGSGAVMNDGLLSGNLDFAAGGSIPLAVLWSKTVGTPNEVRAVCGLNAIPMYLDTRNPDVKSIHDFTEKDKIAVPAIKVSIQAVTLQMAAEKEFGQGQQNRLDPLTVSMSHPDAQTALLSGAGEITAHFSSPPFQYQQLATPGIHTVLNSYDVLGGPATFNVVWTSSKFRNENPKLYDAFVKAMEEATAIINRDKKAAAETYLRLSRDKDTVADIQKMLNDPNIVYTQTPQSIMKYADFMSKVGAIKVKPDSWKDLFFPNVHNLPGS